MSYCKKCGALLDEDAEFCPECGTRVSKTHSAKKATNNDSRDINQTVRLEKPIYGVTDLSNLPAEHMIDDRYEIKKKLGQGGFGTVYHAYDHKMNVDKALKLIPEAVTNDLLAMKNLRNESQTMIQLNHPNIVRFYDFHDQGVIKYIDMEFVDGNTLNAMLYEQPYQKMLEDRVKQLALLIIEGMIYAHRKGVIHRDIKPQNIMVTKEGQVKIMDFGIAETLRNSMSRLQPTGSSGTLVYMSPEQITGEKIGKESDIYSFGAMVYELLSGHPPFYEGSVLYQILNKPVKNIEAVSDEMNQLLQKCLSKKIEYRFSSFEDVIQSFIYKKGKLKSSKNIKGNRNNSINNNQISYRYNFEDHNESYHINYDKSLKNRPSNHSIRNAKVINESEYSIKHKIDLNRNKNDEILFTFFKWLIALIPGVVGVILFLNTNLSVYVGIFSFISGSLTFTIPSNIIMIPFAILIVYIMYLHGNKYSDFYLFYHNKLSYGIIQSKFMASSVVIFTISISVNLFNIFIGIIVSIIFLIAGFYAN